MRVKKSVILAFLVAVGILLQLLESFIGIFMIVPGYRLALQIFLAFLQFIFLMKNNWLLYRCFVSFCQA